MNLFEIAMARAAPAAATPPNALVTAALQAAAANQMPPAAGQTPPPDAGNLPGVPFGEDGRPGPDSATMRQMQEDADRSRAKDALLSYGDTTIIPSFGEMGSRAWSGIRDAGEAALAFGPQGEALAGAGRGMAAFLDAARNAPRAVTATVIGEKALAKPTQARITQNLSDEVTDLIAKGRQYGIEPGPMPDVPLTTEELGNVLSVIRDNMRVRIATREAELERVNAAAPKTSVPSVDGRGPLNERSEILDALEANPYVQPIPGRQGLPTKQQQIDTARQYFEQGGRLDPPGPWGRDMPETVRQVMQGPAPRNAAGETVQRAAQPTAQTPPSPSPTQPNAPTNRPPPPEPMPPGAPQPTPATPAVKARAPRPAALNNDSKKAIVDSVYARVQEGQRLSDVSADDLARSFPDVDRRVLETFVEKVKSLAGQTGSRTDPRRVQTLRKMMDKGVKFAVPGATGAGSANTLYDAATQDNGEF